MPPAPHAPQKVSSKRAAPANPSLRRILALDYGRARIGLALADADARIARPLGLIARKNRNEDMRRLREIIREHGVRQIVVGLPLRLDGTPGEMAEEAGRFAERIRKQIGLPVEMVDERLTSWEAAQSGGKNRKQEGKDSVDALAAALILREYLEQTATTNATATEKA
ncbi:MAG: Holliday junction resolvase RuvX [Acidobacteriia bacterium]|nr:Holliday junction resolvase RuvX [Terriglobia bacterium]